MNNLTNSFLSVALLLSTISIAQTSTQNENNSIESNLSENTSTLDVTIESGAETSTWTGPGPEPTHTDFTEKAVNIEAMNLLDEIHKDEAAQNKLLSGIILGNIEIIALALKEGADVNRPDHNGNLPIHIAASFDDINVIKYLIREGANAEAALMCGVDRRQLVKREEQELPQLREQPLLLALKSGHFQTAKLLIQEGADIDARDSDGMLPIHWAAVLGATDIVELLIGEGADVSAEIEPPSENELDSDETSTIEIDCSEPTYTIT